MHEQQNELPLTVVYQSAEQVKNSASPGPTPSSGRAETTRVSSKVVLAYLICAAIWGTTWYAIRICIASDGYPALPAAGLRFVISTIIMAGIWFAMRKRIECPSIRQFSWIFLAGALAGIAYALLYVSEQQISGGLAAVVSANGPLIAAMIAMVTRTERPSKMTIVGSLIAIVGVAFVYHDRLQVSPQQAAAVAIMILNCFVVQSSNVVMKRQGSNVSALASNTIFFLAAAIALMIGAAFNGQLTYPTPALGPTLALLYLTLFGTLISFAAWFYVLKRVRLSTAMTMSFITPIIAIIVDALFEKHVVLTFETYLGCGIVLCGVAATVLVRARKDMVST